MSWNIIADVCQCVHALVLQCFSCSWYRVLVECKVVVASLKVMNVTKDRHSPSRGCAGSAHVT